ncbi:helix-turn-helix domain-containing protein [Actinoplanes sp. RD1]|uniref:helix-turn-helix domain-containing protein n=1 Tax=Actinoplanes sp. RD1 TaxID=3064538 RepID=UPI0027408E16|nr:helix-turn-helix transcriptional regulator [Actinoplanes sp. RD1]
MGQDANLNELGEFLKARRARISPAQAGLPEGAQARRVPGLRREEVAVLAAISTDYYTRVEQGRMRASPPILEHIARVLGLDDDERDYMFELAGDPISPRPRRGTRQKVDPQLQRLLDDLSMTPAFVIGTRTEVLAWNPIGAALLTDFGRIPEKDRFFLRVLFTDPALRNLYADWEDVARMAIAQVRRDSTRHPHDPRLATLVGELSMRDAQFRQWWAAHDVAHRGTGTKHLRHPIVGDLSLDWNTLSCATDPDQSIIVWTAEPGSPSHDGLSLLAHWAADPARTAVEIIPD